MCMHKLLVVLAFAPVFAPRVIAGVTRQQKDDSANAAGETSALNQTLAATGRKAESKITAFLSFQGNFPC